MNMRVSIAPTRKSFQNEDSDAVYLLAFQRWTEALPAGASNCTARTVCNELWAYAMR